MDVIEHDQTEPETTDEATTINPSPFQEICQRHHAKIHTYHACPQCVMEEVRRHERRIGTLFECEAAIPADAIERANKLMSETR
jgi:ribosomal protein L37AE/L43A